MHLYILYGLLLQQQVHVFTKYAWVKHLKDKKSKTVLNTIIKTVNESNHKPNK